MTFLDLTDLAGPFTRLDVEWHGTPDGPECPLSFNQVNHLAAFRATGRSTWIGGTLPVAGVEPDAVADALRRVLARHEALRCVPAEMLVGTPEGPGDAPSAGSAGDGEAPGPSGVTPTPDRTHPDRTDADRRALDVWRRFFGRTGGRIPAAPVELLDPVPVDGPSSATAASALPAPAHRVIDLVPADRMTGDLGERTFAVALTELARALEPETGRAELPVVIPVHTRGGRRSPLHDLVGWFVTNAPVIADARDVDATRAWLRDAVTVAGLPLERVFAEFTPDLPAGGIFMVSSVDFRARGPRIPGARYISATSPTDTLQLWFSRTDDAGLSVRVRHPGTRRADEVVTRILERLRRGLARHA
ncbi:hypothetical protein MTQ16_07355 [Corynebacterium bovis]|uniref:hypothetical protein n=1 Tax=Corynebacterium bovis TaxID=36808 RepID=UPI0031393B7E